MLCREGSGSPGDLLRSLYHSLQAFPVQSRSAAVPDGGTAGQDALNIAAVEVAEDLRRHAKLPQPPQKMQPCWALFTSCVVLSDQVRSSLIWMPIYMKLLSLCSRVYGTL